MVDIPVVVRNRAVSVGAQDWLDGLGDLIANLEHEWSFVAGKPFNDSSEAYVAKVRLLGDAPAVIKLVVPGRGDVARNEIAVLQLADGDGCPRLFRSDVERGAMLQEQLGPSLRDLRLPLRRRHEILCSVAARVWQHQPDPLLPTGAGKARSFIEFIERAWDEVDRPCSRKAVDDALACAERRLAAHDPERAVLVHGDVHEWNTLQAGTGFKLVDPDGLAAEPEYDLGVIMREDPDDLLTGDPMNRARWLAARTGLDAAAIWEWGVVERISTGLLGTKINLQPVARQMLAVADRVAAR